MKKLIIVSALLITSFNSSATVESRILTCVDRSKDNFQFDVKFEGQTARVMVKGSTYNLRYERIFDGPKGKLFRVYGNQEFTVSTSHPYDNFVFLQTKERSPRPIAAAHCT